MAGYREQICLEMQFLAKELFPLPCGISGGKREGEMKPLIDTQELEPCQLYSCAYVCISVCVCVLAGESLREGWVVHDLGESAAALIGNY